MAGGRRSKLGFWLILTLAACGGRTLDDGAYEAPGNSDSNADGTCRYNGVTVPNGTLIADPCVCFCDRGQFQCQSGCDGPGSSMGGASASGAGTISAGAPFAGAAGATTAGAPSAGAPSGGALGVAGAPAIMCGPVLHATATLPLIDDMEDGNGRIAPFDGRNGVWFTYNDATPGGKQFPPPSSPTFPMQLVMDPLSDGRYAANTYGSGFTSWGAGMGLVLTSGGCPYDAGVYQGVRFYARADQATSMYTLFPTADTNPPSAGGTCQELTGHSCFDSYRAEVGLGPDWQTYYIDFALLTQQGWGQPVVFDQKKLIGINFQMPIEAGSFSIQVDDVTFF